MKWIDRMLWPVHRRIWKDGHRRTRKLLCFAEVEGDGGRDILRAAELTSDPLLRRLYLVHAMDELRHSDLFRDRGAALARASRAGLKPVNSGWFGVGDHGIDDLCVDQEGDEDLLAFLHLAEKTAAGRFRIYREMVPDDPQTRAIFEEILRDEVFHMNYTYTQLTRISPHYRRRLWRARASRLWKTYLRIAAGIAGLFGEALLTVQYFVLLPPFAWLAKRAARREPVGWVAISGDRNHSLKSQY